MFQLKIVINNSTIPHFAVCYDQQEVYVRLMSSCTGSDCLIPTSFFSKKMQNAPSSSGQKFFKLVANNLLLLHKS